MKDLYIIGAGGFGRETAWLVERMNQQNLEWNLKGFIDDDSSLEGMELDGYPVCGGCSYLWKLEQEAWVVCSVGGAETRRGIVEGIKGNKHIRFATLVDPDVKVSGHVSIGEGSIICAGSILTVDIKIGSHNIINLDCTVGHDAMLGDFVTLYPSVNVSGMARVGTATELGTGAQVIQGIEIGRNTIIGAGAVVVKNIPDCCTAVGSPARVIKYHNNLSGGGKNCPARIRKMQLCIEAGIPQSRRAA